MVGEFAGSEKNRLPQTEVLEVDADIRERGTPVFGSVPAKDKVLCSFRPILGDGRLNEVWVGRS